MDGDPKDSTARIWTCEGSMKLDMSIYEPFGLEAIETASRDEIAGFADRAPETHA
jgi:hypothetical protein